MQAARLPERESSGGAGGAFVELLRLLW